MTITLKEILIKSFRRKPESSKYQLLLDSGFRRNDEKQDTLNVLRYILTIVAIIVAIQQAHAHHVLGRPSYSLSEDSNTPPSMQVETQIGEYYVTFMAYPAFPKPNEQGRVNLYASRIDNGNTFDGEVTFKVRDNSWFSDKQEVIGVQKIDDGVYRQGFIFKEAGDYIIIAEFESGGEPYIIDFPLRIGEPVPIGPIGVAVFVIILVLVGVNLTQRKRMQRLKASQHHADVATESSRT